MTNCTALLMPMNLLSSLNSTRMSAPEAFTRLETISVPKWGSTPCRGTGISPVAEKLPAFSARVELGPLCSESESSYYLMATR